MEECLAKLRIKFLTFLKDMLRKIYSYRLERAKAFKCLELNEDICWIIEAKVSLASELNKSFIKHMPRMGRNSYSKKKRIKKMRVCHKCVQGGHVISTIGVKEWF